MYRVTQSCKRANHSRRCAFSLVESVVCTLIVGVMLVSALRMVGVSARARQVTASLTHDNGLAVSLLSEILQARYAEAVEPYLVEGPEVEFDSSVTGPSSAMTRVVDQDYGVGQYINPTLPADAESWSVTRVKLNAARQGASDGGVTKVQMHEGDADGTPIGAMLEEVAVSESALSSSLAWVDINFTSVTNLSPGAGVCLTMTAETGEAMQIERIPSADNIPGNGELTSDNGGPWVLDTGRSLRFLVFGRVASTESPTQPIGPDSPESSSSRAEYDDVDDYDQWSASPPEERDGTPLTGYEGWTRSVTVEYVDSDDPDGAAINEDLGLKRITVTVTDPAGRTNKQIAFRARTGVYEQEPDQTKTYTSWIGLKMQIGDDAPLVVGTDLLNEPVSVAN